MAVILRQRRDTEENWTSANPIIPDGQLCFDITNNTFRVGDGSTVYLSLPIQSGPPGLNGTGVGDLLSTNNLSEIIANGNIATARSNLGLGSAATSATTAFEPADLEIAKKDEPNIFVANQTFFETTETVYQCAGLDINPLYGNKQYKILGSHVALTSSLEDGQSVRLRITGGNIYLVTWPDPAVTANITSVKWVTSAGNTAPTTTADDVFVIEREGSVLYIYYLGSAV